MERLSWDFYMLSLMLHSESCYHDEPQNVAVLGRLHALTSTQEFSVLLYAFTKISNIPSRNCQSIMIVLVIGCSFYSGKDKEIMMGQEEKEYCYLFGKYLISTFFCARHWSRCLGQYAWIKQTKIIAMELLHQRWTQNQ